MSTRRHLPVCPPPPSLCLFDASGPAERVAPLERSKRRLSRNSPMEGRSVRPSVHLPVMRVRDRRRPPRAEFTSVAMTQLSKSKTPWSPLTLPVITNERLQIKTLLAAVLPEFMGPKSRIPLLEISKNGCETTLQKLLSQPCLKVLKWYSLNI